MSNIYNLFKFLEKKKGTKTPLKVKFIYAPDELTDEGLNVEGDLDLSYSKITSLPDNLQVGGNLDLSYSKITSLPDNLKVGGYLALVASPITSLPDNLSVGSSLYLGITPIDSLPDNLKVEKDLYLQGTLFSKKYTKEEIIKMLLDKGGYFKGNIYV